VTTVPNAATPASTASMTGTAHANTDWKITPKRTKNRIGPAILWVKTASILSVQVLRSLVARFATRATNAVIQR